VVFCSSLSPRVGLPECGGWDSLLWLGLELARIVIHTKSRKNNKGGEGGKRCLSRLAVINFNP
jgi:hypothetical protein